MAKSNSPHLLRGSFTGTGRSDHLQTIGKNIENGTQTIQITGTFVATIDLQRSSDEGATWDDVVGESYTVPTDNIIEVGSTAFVYSLNCSAFTSGTADFVIAQ